MSITVYRIDYPVITPIRVLSSKGNQFVGLDPTGHTFQGSLKEYAKTEKEARDKLKADLLETLANMQTRLNEMSEQLNELEQASMSWAK